MRKVNFNNKSCINVSSEFYTGKECSPKGLGYSAIIYDIGYEKIGTDNQIWSVQMKNGKKVWFRKSGMPQQMTHEEPLITEEIKEEIKEEIEIVSQPQVKNNKTDYNIFCSYYTNKLKTENTINGMKKSNMEIRTEAIEEWKKLKLDKSLLESTMKQIKSL